MLFCFFFQAEDGIRDLVRSRGLGDVYKRQAICDEIIIILSFCFSFKILFLIISDDNGSRLAVGCLLYTSDAADERSSVDLGGRRIIKKKKNVIKL